MSDRGNFFTSFLIFLILSGLFILSMFFRVSNAVIAPNLIRDLRLSAETLGILGGAYFYSFTLLQIPMGPMLDRIGPRFVLTSLPLIGSLGAFLFATGESFGAVLLGRILLGVGMACALMGALKVFTLRFSPERFATLTGTFLSAGTLGSVLAASPLVYLSSTIGWRATFMIAGGITILLALSVCWVLGGEKTKEEPFAFSSSTERKIGILHSSRMLLKSLPFWQIGAVAFFRYGTFVCLQGLWLGPYLMDAKGYSPAQTGRLLTILAIGWIVGGPIGGRLSDRTFRSRKKVALWSLSLYCLSLFPLVGGLEIRNSFWYVVIFFVMGFSNVTGMVILSHAKELFPVSISGTVMTSVNFFTMAGGAVFMPALGWIIESFPRTAGRYPAEAYHLSFLICFLGMAASLIFYSFSKEKGSPAFGVRRSEAPN